MLIMRRWAKTVKSGEIPCHLGGKLPCGHVQRVDAFYAGKGCIFKNATRLSYFTYLIMNIYY